MAEDLKSIAFPGEVEPIQIQEAVACVSLYLENTQFLNGDGSLNVSSIPDFLGNCQLIFAASNTDATESSTLHVLEGLTVFFENLLERGELTAAEEVFGCVHSNLANICKCSGIYGEDNIRNLSVFLIHAVPNRIEDFSDEGWSFTNLLMDIFASGELRAQPYINGDIYEIGGNLLSFDLLLTNLLKSRDGEIRFTNLVTTIIARRYGFKRHKILDEVSSKRQAHVRYATSEAMDIYRIWGQCDGRNYLTLIEMGTTEDEDITRMPTTEEITMRRVQKVRRNFQVLERLRDTDSLKVARKLYRTNGIANFNRYSIGTLSTQYEIQMSPCTQVPDYKLSFLTLLPYSDYNGAYEGEHFVVNQTSREIREVIIEAGSRREALASILRSVQGTASRQHRNQNLYPIPFEYVYIDGHSDNEKINLGISSKDGLLSGTLDIQLVEDAEFYNWLYRHRLIDSGTIVILGGCKTAEDNEHYPWHNLAKTVMKKLRVSNVIAAKTRTYGDQHPVIFPDYTAGITPTSNRRKPIIVNIADEQV